LTAARALADEGMAIGSVGNISARADGAIRITPTALTYDRMSRADLVTVAPDGRTLRGRRAPSRELPLHLAVYEARPDVGAVVHCHSPWATAWSFIDEPLGPSTEEMTYYGIGPVRTSRPASAGSPALAAAAVEALGASLGALLGRHGTLAVGETVQQAMTVARALEHQAHVAWLVRLRAVAPVPAR
jgi:L-fuculose-phosphate aldolase